MEKAGAVSSQQPEDTASCSERQGWSRPLDPGSQHRFQNDLLGGKLWLLLSSCLFCFLSSEIVVCSLLRSQKKALALGLCVSPRMADNLVTRQACPQTSLELSGDGEKLAKGESEACVNLHETN